MCAAIRCEHRRHLLEGRHCTELVVGELDGDVDQHVMAYVDDHAPGLAAGQGPVGSGASSNRAIVPMGRWVAERPIRTGLSVVVARRSSLSKLRAR